MSTTVVEQEFRRRLRLIMQQFGSVADLARAVGVSDNAIYKWASGRGQPSLSSLVALAKAARVSIEWLATGEGAPNHPKTKPTSVQAGEYTLMPRFSLRATGGRPGIQSGRLVDYIAVKTEWLHRRLNLDARSVLLIEVAGDSMAPTTEDGDLALVDPREVRVGRDGVYLLKVGSELSVRRLQWRPDGKLIVQSDNPAYQTAVVAPESVNVLGRLVWIGHKL